MVNVIKTLKKLLCFKKTEEHTVSDSDDDENSEVISTNNISKASDSHIYLKRQYRVSRSCNINEFIEWARDNKLFMNCTIKRLEHEAAYFTAYISFLNMHYLEDTVQLRKHWYTLQRNKTLEESLLNSGF